MEKVIQAELVDDTANLTPAKKAAGDVVTKRNMLLKEYYGGDDSLYDKIKKNPDGDNVDSIFGIVITEIIKETDNLLGNGLIFTKDGNLQDASTISVKRTEILETLTKVLTRKKDLITSSFSVDLDSPAFKIFQIMCFENLTGALDKLNIDNEQKQLIISSWVESMKDWQKELNNRLSDAKQQK